MQKSKLNGKKVTKSDWKCVKKCIFVGPEPKFKKEVMSVLTIAMGFMALEEYRVPSVPLYSNVVSEVCSTGILVGMFDVGSPLPKNRCTLIALRSSTTSKTVAD